MTVQGLEQLSKRLDELKKEIRYKGGRTGLRKAANVVAKAAKDKAMTFDDGDTGRSIANMIAVRWGARQFKRTGNLVFRVGVLKGAVIPKNNKDEGLKGPVPHWRLIEFGTSIMRAQPFMRPAMENNLTEIEQTFIRETNKAIDRAIKRGA